MSVDSAKAARLKLSAVLVADLPELQSIFSTTLGQRPPRWASRAFLAPDMKRAILDGSQPIEVTAERLTRLEDFPMDWADQRRLFGFSQP